MNEVLAKRMKRRRFRTKFKNYSLIALFATLVITASVFSMDSFADDNFIVNVDDGEFTDEKIDILKIEPTMYLSDMTLDGFKMKTKYLKIENADGVKVDTNELQYIFQYCSLWDVETLDLSEVSLLDNEFLPRILIPCKSVKKVILPNNITKIGDFVFYEWSNLEEINMPDELVEIGKAAFSGCKNLKYPVFGNKIEKINEQVFLGCEKFDYIELPNSLKYLGRFSFADCANLKEIVLPNNDDFTIDGNLMVDTKPIVSVYFESDAFNKMVPQKDKTVSYNIKNRILIKPIITNASLKKVPKISQLIKEINIGDEIELDEFISSDLEGTNALSYKVRLASDQAKIYDLPQGNNKVKYIVTYYLADLDISNITKEVEKIDEVSDLEFVSYDFNTDNKYYLLANTVSFDETMTLKVINHASKISKNVKELSEKYSRTLNKQKHVAYMAGFKDGSFRPKDEMTNAEVATIIARINNFDENKKYTVNYYDVKQDSWMTKYIGYVTEKKIMTGSYGYFRPNEKITRGEFVIAISKMIGLKPVYQKSSFYDVWGKYGEEYIVAFEQLGIVGGLSNGSFGYSQTITRAEAAHIINAALGRTITNGKHYDDIKAQVNFTDVAEFNWFYKDVVEATTTHYEYELH